MVKIHTSSYTPIKKKKQKVLVLREKEYNRELAKQRIYIEHVIRCLKIFGFWHSLTVIDDDDLGCALILLLVCIIAGFI